MAVIIVSAGYYISLSVNRASEKTLLVLRIDDVQDFAFRDAQLHLFRSSLANKISVSLSVIAKLFGSDKELVDTVRSMINLGCEVTVHGWEHENLTKLTSSEQGQGLRRAKERLKAVLSVDATVLVPPLFSYNNDTLQAMRMSRYGVVSGLAELHQAGQVSEGILSIPATIELSNFSNGTWRMKSVETVIDELSMSTRIYGYGVIVTHPQEFFKGGTVDQDSIKTYEQLIQSLQANYFFTTFEKLRNNIIYSESRVSDMQNISLLNCKLAVFAVRFLGRIQT